MRASQGLCRRYISGGRSGDRAFSVPYLQWLSNPDRGRFPRRSKTTARAMAGRHRPRIRSRWHWRRTTDVSSAAQPRSGRPLPGRSVRRAGSCSSRRWYSPARTPSAWRSRRRPAAALSSETRAEEACAARKPSNGVWPHRAYDACRYPCRMPSLGARPASTRPQNLHPLIADLGGADAPSLVARHDIQASVFRPLEREGQGSDHARGRVGAIAAAGVQGSISADQADLVYATAQREPAEAYVLARVAVLVRDDSSAAPVDVERNRPADRTGHSNFVGAGRRERDRSFNRAGAIGTKRFRTDRVPVARMCRLSWDQQAALASED